MALPDSGTFNYLVTVPEENGPKSFPWLLELGEEIEPRGDALCDDRLVGYSPLLSVGDGGVTADSFGLRDEVRLSRFTLRAINRTHASSRELSFEIDRELIPLFRPGDELRLKHSCMWGTGLTLLRGESWLLRWERYVGSSVTRFGSRIRKMPWSELCDFKKFLGNTEKRNHYFFRSKFTWEKK